MEVTGPPAPTSTDLCKLHWYRWQLSHSEFVSQLIQLGYHQHQVVQALTLVQHLTQGTSSAQQSPEPELIQAILEAWRVQQLLARVQHLSAQSPSASNDLQSAISDLQATLARCAGSQHHWQRLLSLQAGQRADAPSNESFGYARTYDQLFEILSLYNPEGRSSALVTATTPQGEGISFRVHMVNGKLQTDLPLSPQELQQLKNFRYQLLEGEPSRVEMAARIPVDEGRPFDGDPASLVPGKSYTLGPYAGVYSLEDIRKTAEEAYLKLRLVGRNSELRFNVLGAVASSEAKNPETHHVQLRVFSKPNHQGNHDIVVDYLDRWGSRLAWRDSDGSILIPSPRSAEGVGLLKQRYRSMHFEMYRFTADAQPPETMIHHPELDTLEEVSNSTQYDGAKQKQKRLEARLLAALQQFSQRAHHPDFIELPTQVAGAGALPKLKPDVIYWAQPDGVSSLLETLKRWYKEKFRPNYPDPRGAHEVMVVNIGLRSTHADRRTKEDFYMRIGLTAQQGSMWGRQPEPQMQFLTLDGSLLPQNVDDAGQVQTYLSSPHLIRDWPLREAFHGAQVVLLVQHMVLPGAAGTLPRGPQPFLTQQALDIESGAPATMRTIFKFDTTYRIVAGPARGPFAKVGQLELLSLQDSIVSLVEQKWGSGSDVRPLNVNVAVKDTRGFTVHFCMRLTPKFKHSKAGNYFAVQAIEYRDLNGQILPLVAGKQVVRASGSGVNLSAWDVSDLRPTVIVFRAHPENAPFAPETKASPADLTTP